MKKMLAVVVLTAVAVAGCATSRLGRSQLSLVSAGELSQMGVQAFDAIKKETPQETNAATNRYVRCVADAIVREIPGGSKTPWEVVVFRDDDPNAFALPGGKIGVNTGLFKVAKTPNQLATVIAHEISHVLNNHGGERMSQDLAVQTGLEVAQAMIASPDSTKGQLIMAALGLGAEYGVLLPFSREQESEADLDGLDMMAQAGFDPRESVQLWRNMSAASGGDNPLPFLSTHPSHSTRISDLNNRMARVVPMYQKAQQMGKKPNCKL